MRMYSFLRFWAGFGLICIVTSSNIQRPGKLIIDTDPGGDDALALLFTLAAEKDLKACGFEIIAITCSYGNARVETVVSNVQKILTIMNRSDIPVYMGADKPLLLNVTFDNYFGRDGMGDVDFQEDITAKIDRSKHASVALVDLARQHAGNVSIMALGPLTNLAIAISLDPNFVHNVERFHIMGGSVHSIGNIGPNMEYNFYQDPESSFIVLNKTITPPAILLPWETALVPIIPMKWRTDVLGAIDSKIVRFLNRVEMGHFQKPNWTPIDLMLAALTLWPDLITRTFLTNVTPVYDGAARGVALVDYNNKTGKPFNAIILDDYDTVRFQNLVLQYFA